MKRKAPMKEEQKIRKGSQRKYTPTPDKIDNNPTMIHNEAYPKIQYKKELYRT